MPPCVSDSLCLSIRHSYIRHSLTPHLKVKSRLKPTCFTNLPTLFRRLPSGLHRLGSDQEFSVQRFLFSLFFDILFSYGSVR